MNASTTDWQGQLRVRDLVGDALRLAARRPIGVLVIPALLVTAGTRFELLLNDAPMRFGFWSMLMAQEYLGLVLLALGPIWVALAWDQQTRPAERIQRLRRMGIGALVAGLLGLGVMLATAFTYVGGIVLLGLLATAVPELACDRDPDAMGSSVRAVKRSIVLSRGSGVRIVSAWVVLAISVALLAAAFGLGVAWVVEPILDSDQVELLVHVVIRSTAGVGMGMTMALSVAAFRRLLPARTVLDVDAWVEVFR